MIDVAPRQAHRYFANVVERAGLPGSLLRLSLDLAAFYDRGDREALRAACAPFLALEQRWYDSLAAGDPDLGIYTDPLYVADAYACWLVYSRLYVRALRRAGVLAEIGDPGSVVDVGCGIAFTTAMLREVYPDATVIGTNVPGPQLDVARAVAADHDFYVTTGPPERADVVFALEFFEHFPRPLDALADVLYLRPRALVVANTFGPRSPGHFGMYRVDGRLVSPRQASRAFNDALRASGFEKVDTGVWNNKPTYWRRSP